MGPAFRLHLPLRHLLQTIISNGRCSAHTRLKIPGLDEIVSFGMVSPDTGETIGLQFHTHGERIAFGGRHALLCSGNLLGYAE